MHPSDGGDTRRTGRLAAVTALSILPIADEDLAFVRMMLYEAAFWRGTSDAPPIDEALNQSNLRGGDGQATPV